MLVPDAAGVRGRPFPGLRRGGRARPVPVQPGLEPPRAAETALVVMALEDRDDAPDGARAPPRSALLRGAGAGTAPGRARAPRRSSPVSVAASAALARTRSASASLPASISAAPSVGRSSARLAPSRGQRATPLARAARSRQAGRCAREPCDRRLEPLGRARAELASTSSSAEPMSLRQRYACSR